MPPFERHLPQERILALRKASIDAGLATPTTIDLLRSGISREYVSLLPIAPSPAEQLLNDLVQMNGIERLSDGSVPLAIWLQNAVAFTESKGLTSEFVKALAALRVFVPGEARLPEPEQLPEFLEAIVHEDDMVPYGFLAGGHTAGLSVAKVNVPRFDKGVPAKDHSGAPLLYEGTGWLVTPDLLMTNHHVLNARNPGETPAGSDDFQLQARQSYALFDFHSDRLKGTRTDFVSVVCSDRELDYAIARMAKPTDRAGLLLAKNRLSVGKNGFIPVNIIQHPGGEPKKIALRNNLVSASTDTDLRYFTDTRRGSSGSPVLSDDWMVLALHRGARPVTGVKFQGKATAWVNYGTQIQAIMEHLNKGAPELASEIMRAQGRH